MGAWGTGFFENDDALDWVYDLEESDDTTLIEESLRAIVESEEEYLEAPECAMALAAAEVTAALKGMPRPGLTDEVKAWIQHNKIKPDSNIVELALKAIARIKSDSELKELWDESEEASNWYQELDGLEKRLIR